MEGFILVNLLIYLIERFNIKIIKVIHRSKGNNKISIIYQFLEDKLIKKWVGVYEIKKEFELSGVYKAIKTGNKYKNFLWKKETISKVEQ